VVDPAFSVRMFAGSKLYRDPMPSISRILGAAAGLLAPVALSAQPVSRPTLVVLVTVDQLAPRYFTRWGGQFTGGLHRLYQGGAVLTDAYQDHGITETAPGHAVTLSGRYPRGTGIVRNASGVQDPRAPIVGGGPAGGASPFRFRGSTLIDWMRRADPRSRALSVSRKDRSAILPLGRARESVFWYALDGRFSTSRYYADTLPAWVRSFNARRTVQRLQGRSWTLLLPDSAYSEQDSVTAESRGRDLTFPHRLSGDSAVAADSVMGTPWMDEMTLDLALAGVEAMHLGEGPSTDLLAVSLSATDAVGHRFGPDSREIHDQVLRLDRMLGVFLDSLFALRGRDRVVIALTADHGITPFPEVRHPGAFAGGYVSRAPFQRWLWTHAKEMGVDSAAIEFDDGVVYYDPAAFAARGRDPHRLMTEFLEFARRQPGVLRADRLADLVRDSTRDRLARRWARMFPADLPVGAVVTQTEGSFWGVPGGESAQHGSVHDLDAHVPLIFYGRPFRPGRYTDRAAVVDLAPTLAAVLGVRPAEALDGRVLRQVLR
jgi:hypothetical protein